MATESRRCKAPSSVVWEVLADPWMYPSWVVGASRLRDVEGSWPEAGARIHHSVGAWPLLLDDHTEVLEAHPPRELTLQAKGRPIGEARVVMRVVDDGAGSLITMDETVERGPGAALPDSVVDPFIAWRNREALRRLALIAEGRAGLR